MVVTTATEMAAETMESRPITSYRVCLQAVSRKESGAWLHAIPNSLLGLRMDNETIRVVVLVQSTFLSALCYSS